jgi:hypothetical protein
MFFSYSCYLHGFDFVSVSLLITLGKSGETQSSRKNKIIAFARTRVIPVYEILVAYKGLKPIPLPGHEAKPHR